MGDPTRTPYGLVYGVDAFGNPLQPHVIAADAPGPIRGEPIPLTSPIAQWKQEPQMQPQPTEKGPSTFPDHQKNQLHETRRSQFSGQIFSSLIVHSGANASEQNLSRMAQLAVRAADLLLVELEKPTKG